MPGSPIIYGNIFPIKLSDDLTVKPLSENDIKGNNLFFETLEYILTGFIPDFQSEDVRQTSDKYLKDVNYDYDEAKKNLFADFDFHIKKLTLKSLKNEKNKKSQTK